MLRKIGFYFLSLWLLFFSIIIITIDIPVYWGADWEFVGIRYLFFENIIPFACIVSLLIGCCSFYDFIYTTNGSPELSFKITQLEVHITWESLNEFTYSGQMNQHCPTGVINLADGYITTNRT